MTKEELEKEAEEWIIKNSREFITNPNYSPFDYAEAIYLASAEPREKRIAELEAIVRNTKAVDESFAKLQLENTELKAQIEKMKNCKNCKKLKKEKDGLLICTAGSFYTNTFGENCDKWEMKENDRRRN